MAQVRAALEQACVRAVAQVSAASRRQAEAQRDLDSAVKALEAQQEVVACALRAYDPPQGPYAKKPQREWRQIFIDTGRCASTRLSALERDWQDSRNECARLQELLVATQSGPTQDALHSALDVSQRAEDQSREAFFASRPSLLQQIEKGRLESRIEADLLASLLAARRKLAENTKKCHSCKRALAESSHFARVAEQNLQAIQSGLVSAGCSEQASELEGVASTVMEEAPGKEHEAQKDAAVVAGCGGGIGDGASAVATTEGVDEEKAETQVADETLENDDLFEEAGKDDQLEREATDQKDQNETEVSVDERGEKGDVADLLEDQDEVTENQAEPEQNPSKRSRLGALLGSLTNSSS